jgi:glyoxylase-like metal-dependent hydrolase (beta-lactamase superfamily II)
MASLDLLLDRDEEIYWPTHGPVVEKPNRFVRAFITHRRMREAAILQQLKSGLTTIPDIVKRIYSDVAPGLHPAAAMSVLAHMEHLIEREKIATDGAPAINSIYRVK